MQKGKLRTSVEDRFYRVFTYQAVDRVPDIEFGYWPQTIRRWLKEGLSADMESEKNAYFSRKLDRFLGLDEPAGVTIDLRVRMNPAFQEEVLERKAGSVIMRDQAGVIAERFGSDTEDSSIPHYIKFPVQTPDDWAAMKERYRFDDPVRIIPTEDIEKLRGEMGAKMVYPGPPGFWLTGVYGQLREWMGMENLSCAFYEYPEMVHDMVAHWTELIERQLARLPPDVPIDLVWLWEDMASKNGPFVGPKMFREFLQPGYRRIMSAARRRGCVLGMVDCDGNPHDIVANWLEEGINIMFPLEVASGADPFAWRREFGRDLLLRGGIAKAPLVLGGKAIDRELERIKPLLDQEGYIPHLDHLVPPDIPFKHYCDYLGKKRKLIGK